MEYFSVSIRYKWHFYKPESQCNPCPSWLPTKVQLLSQKTTIWSCSFTYSRVRLHCFYWGHITEDHMVKCHINSYDNCNLRPLGYYWPGRHLQSPWPTPGDDRAGDNGATARSWPLSAAMTSRNIGYKGVTSGNKISLDIVIKLTTQIEFNQNAPGNKEYSHCCLEWK